MKLLPLALAKYKWDDRWEEKLLDLKGLIIEWKRKRRENEGYRKYVYVRDIGGGAST